MSGQLRACSLQSRSNIHLAEGQEEGQWVVLGASVEGLEAVLAEVAQAWEVPVSGSEQQTGTTVAAAALRLQWKTQSLQELPHCVAAAVVVMSPQTLSLLPPPPPPLNIPPLLSLLLEFPDLETRCIYKIGPQVITLITKKKNDHTK